MPKMKTKKCAVKRMKTSATGSCGFVAVVVSLFVFWFSDFPELIL